MKMYLIYPREKLFGRNSFNPSHLMILLILSMLMMKLMAIK
jgi:hypothetical protein